MHITMQQQPKAPNSLSSIKHMPLLDQNPNAAAVEIFVTFYKMIDD
jgi:hypothetical protein